MDYRADYHADNPTDYSIDYPAGLPWGARGLPYARAWGPPSIMFNSSFRGSCSF